MDVPFSWQRFERIARVLESMGYLIAVFGPLFGLAFMVFGDGMVRMAGVGAFVGSIFVAAYHIGFSMLMDAVRDVTRHLDALDHDRTPAPPA